MPTALPIIRAPSTALYPFTQVYTAQTSISDSQAACPARCPKGLPLLHFELGFDPIRQADKNTLKGAFASAKGEFTGGNGSAGLTITTDITYTDLGFDDDTFAAAEQISTQYGVRWKLTQALAQNLAPGVSGGAYPLLAVGVMSMLPYTQRVRFQTIKSKMPSGPKYTYAEFGAGGLFPAGSLMGWKLDEPALIDADVATKLAHWLANWGDAFPFTFTDEDAVTYSNVYYASPTFTIERLDYNRSHVTTELIQMN
jgi:hypothetical protein